MPTTRRLIWIKAVCVFHGSLGESIMNFFKCDADGFDKRMIYDIMS